MNALDVISQTLGAATPVAQLPRPAQSTEMAEAKEAPEVEDDYQEARSNLKELIGQMMEQVPDLINLTQQSQTDKMYSAAASFIKAAADLNISLSKLSKEIKRPDKPKGSSNQPGEAAPVQQVTQNNNVFVGSTEDFLEMMEARRRSALETAVDAEFVEVKT